MNNVFTFWDSVKRLSPASQFDWIGLCVLIFSFGGLISFFIPNNGIQNIAGFAFILIVLFGKKKMPFKGFALLIYLSLLLYSIVITYYTFTEHYHYVMHVTHGSITNIFRSVLFIPNFLPFALLCIDTKGLNIRYVLIMAGLLLSCFLVYYPFAFLNMVTFKFNMNAAGDWGSAGSYGDFISNSTLGISSIAVPVLMVYFKKYMCSTEWKWYLISYLATMVLSLYMARRGATVVSALYLFSCWVLYLVCDKKTSKIKIIFITLIYVALALCLFSVGGDFLLGNLSARGTEDTRSGVELNFWLDMTDKDALWGKGWFGEYYEPFAQDDRPWIETGYLSLILRGGIVYLVLYIAMLLFSAMKGLFFSKNLFVKSFGVVILISLFELYPYGWPKFDLGHLLLWIGGFLCNRKDYRKLSDREIYYMYFK